MTKPTGLRFDALDLTKASDTPFEFEYVGSNGTNTGVFLKVVGSQSKTVTGAVNALVNERRRQQAARESQASVARPGDAVAPVEDDVMFGQRVAAVRLVGWRRPGDIEGLTDEQKARFQGIDEDWSPEQALRLCQINAEIAAQVLQKSNALGNFTPASPTA